MNVLFVGAHPDDIEVWAGGTVLRYVQQGANVFFCIATNGNIGSPTSSKEEIREIRYAEARKSAGLIGAKLIWLDFDDEFLIDSRETRLRFIEAFRQARPDVVICHWPENYSNPDHSATGKIVDECIHMANIPLIETESPICDKIPYVYFWDTHMGVDEFAPELYVDITDVFEKKVELVNCHKSQNDWLEDICGCTLEDFLEIPAKYRGLQSGCRMAEAFRPSYRWGRMFTEHYLPNAKGAVTSQMSLKHQQIKSIAQKKFAPTIKDSANIKI